MTPRAKMASTIGAMLDGALEGDDAVAALGAIDLATLTPEQLAGAVDAVMGRALSFPHFHDALDCCGTGGDGLHTLNISTGAAIVGAACGLVIAKHGNRAVTSQSGSADVLEALGVNTTLTLPRTARLLREQGIGFLFAPSFHPGFARVAPIRKALGRRSIFNLLGPLCNPAHVRRQLIGVFAPELCELVARTCQLLGHEAVMVVHGNDGSDELSVTGTTTIVLLEEGAISTTQMSPNDVLLPTHPASALRGGDAVSNASALIHVLEGHDSAYADAIALNAAALLMLGDRASSITDGIILAKQALTDNRAYETLTHFMQATQKL